MPPIPTPTLFRVMSPSRSQALSAASRCGIWWIWSAAIEGRAPDAAQREAVRCRAGAVTSAGVWYGPGAAKQREERCIAPGTRSASRGLDVILQRFLLVLEFLDAPFDHVADRDQADELAALEHRQMAELAGSHLFHDGRDGIDRPAANHLARHHRAYRFVEHGGAALADH